MITDYDCICQYELDTYITAAGNEIKWCTNCGSLSMAGAPPNYPRFLRGIKDELAKVRGQLRSAEEFAGEERGE